MKQPCYKCEKRSIGCHAVCKEYLEHKRLCEAQKESPEAKYFMIERKYKIEKFYGKKPKLSKKRRRR